MPEPNISESPANHRPHHERIVDPVFRRAVDLIDSGDAPGLAAHLREHPGLINQRVTFEGGNYFTHPTLLEFLAENPIRHGTLPPSILEVAAVLLAAEPSQAALDETLSLVASGRIPRECSVQLPLLERLSQHGANPNSALAAAAGHGEFNAVRKLLELGATATLSTLAALGDTTQFLTALPAADPSERHLALELAAQFGQTDIVRSLLAAGEDPNRFNSPGSHSHSTPLHQAALAGHLEVVRLLVDHGANPHIKDLVWQGTSQDWAKHAGETVVVDYLERLSLK